ncbi:MAG TPA: peptide deformylase [Leptospiraceae bacterium]|nr:peptide deformylase [Leptospiraceae bacterium]
MENKLLSIDAAIKYAGKEKEILSQKSEAVIDFDDDLHELVSRMASTMYFYEAVGISAVQIGIHKSLFIVRVDTDKYATFINPEIVQESEEKENIVEGCLSFPGISIPVERSKEVILKFQEKDGTEKEVQVGGLHARIILHEMDHLKGKTFLDRISVLKRNVILDKMKRIERNGKLIRDRQVINYLENTVKNENANTESR